MKTKPILIIIATLIIGFVIGFLTNGQITRSKFQNFVHQGGYDAFKLRMMNVIKPDPEQMKDIDPLLDKYAQLTHEMLQDSKESMRNINENMIQELKPFLHKDQIERLEEVNKRFQDMWERNRMSPGRSHHPGRPGSGPPEKVR